MELSIVIVNWNVKALLEKALLAVQKYPPNAPYEVFVVDNASADGSIDMVREKFPGVTAIASPVNLGFAEGNNVALKLVKGKYVLLLNPDTEVGPGALQAYIDFFQEHPKAGAVGVKLLNTDGTLQRSCKSFPSWRTLLWSAFFLDVLFPKSPIFGEYEMTYWAHDTERQVDQPMGAALCVRKEVMDTIGLMDKIFFMYFDEVDWCYRIKKAGYEIWFTPRASITHHWGKSTSQAQLNMNRAWHKSFLLYLKKHSTLPQPLIPIFFFALVWLKLAFVLAILFSLGSLIIAITRLIVWRS